MDAVTDALKQAEVFGLGSGSLASVVDWWVAPLDGHYTLQSVCVPSIASKRLEEGLIDASRAYRKHPELMTRYFRFACACVSDAPRTRDFQMPIWLDWIDQAADALRLWNDKVAAMPDEDMRVEFRQASWLAGIAHIRSGRPRVAKRRWIEDAQRICDAAAAKADSESAANEDVRRAAQLAATIGIEGPPVLDGYVESEEIRAALARWWDGIGDPALARLFWEAQLPFLERVRNYPSRPLSTSEKRALTQLINSATRAGMPTFNEMDKVAGTHIKVLMEMLASAGVGAVMKEIVEGQASLLFE